MKTARKLICILIAILLVASLVPVTLASEASVTDHDSFMNAITDQNCHSIFLEADISGFTDADRDALLSINRDLTIDLNGHTINLADKTANKVEDNRDDLTIGVKGGTLTICDGNGSGAEGRITSTHISAFSAGNVSGTIQVYSGGSLEVKSGTIRNNARGQACAICSHGGTVTVGGGTKKAKISAVSNGSNEANGIWCDKSDTASTTLTVKEHAEISARITEGGYNTQQKAVGIYVRGNSAVTMEGGSITATDETGNAFESHWAQGIRCIYGNVTVSGGTISASSEHSQAAGIAVAIRRTAKQGL